MNNVNLVGRLTKDPEVRYSQGDKPTAIARFSVAVNRKFKDANGNYGADFPNCIAFGKTAELLEKHFKKGMAIGIRGRITTGSYTNKDGVKVYTTDVTVEEVEFVESKASAAANSNQSSGPAPSSNDGFMNIIEGIGESVPFN